MSPPRQSNGYAAAAAAPLQHDGQPPAGRDGNLQIKASHDRYRSPAHKRKHDEEKDNEGYRKQGRPRKRAQGSSKVQVEGVGDYQPSVQFYIGNTPGKAIPEVIKKVLAKCSEPLLTDGPLEIEEIELLTLEDKPRTKCWRIVVPYKFLSLMENPELYPVGWRHRRFFGSRKARDNTKQPRLEGNVVDEIMREVEQEKENVLDRHRQKLGSDSHDVSGGQASGSGVGSMSM